MGGRARTRRVQRSTAPSSGMLGIVQDITEHERTKELLREQAETLQIINNFGRVLSAELELQKLVAGADRRGHRAGGRAVRRVLLQRPRRGWRLVHALHGVGRGPPALRAISVTARDVVVRPDVPRRGHRPAWRCHARSALRVRTSRISAFRGGILPVRSYLAIPVVGRSGEVLGGLFFGHSEPDVFAGEAERIIAGLAAQAAIAIDNARLFDAVQKARESAESRQPAEGRISRDGVARAAHAAQRGAGMDVAAAQHAAWTSPSAGRRRSRPSSATRGFSRRSSEDILDVSRIIAGQLRLDSEPMPFRPVVESAIESIRPWPRRKACITMTVELDDDPAIIIRRSRAAAAGRVEICCRTPSSSRPRAGRCG